MYERFFGFHDQPFRLTPDPKYLYLGSKHREGYAHLLYAMREGSGFVCVSGEVGTGKTTLVRALLSEDRDNIAVAYIFNPVLSSIELLQTINAEFGLPARTTSKKELTDALGGFLEAQRATGGRAVIIVDEAQNLDPVVLEQLRLLSNLETATEKLLQIILLGQPELSTLLGRPELRQLSQRIALRWQLEPLARGEARSYLKHRLSVAGGDEDVFDERAIDLVYERTGGVPRLINILAHRALLVAYTKSEPRVTTMEVGMAAFELEQGKVPLNKIKTGGGATARVGGWAYKAAAAGAVAVAAGVVAFLLVAPLGDTGPNAASEAPAPVKRANPAAARPDVDRRAEAQKPPRVERVERVEKTALASAGLNPVTAVAPVQLAEGKRKKDRGALQAGRPGSDEATGKLERRLERASPYESASAAMSRIIELWTGASLAPTEIASGTLDLQLLGARRGLRYLAAEMTPALIVLIDLPAVIELRLPTTGETRYVLLEQLSGDSATLVADKSMTVARHSVEALWTGNAHILWRDAERLSRALIPDSEGQAVGTLQALLTEAGVYHGPISAVYDEETQTAVRQFQESRGLTSNGVAGTVTQIVLYNSLDRFRRPSLATGRVAGPS
jgi:general secretion pathway protein A